MKTRNIALTFFIFHFSFIVSTQSMAQRPSDEEMQARRAEAVEKRADKLAKDFNLEGDAREAFINTYKAFQKDLQGIRRDRQMQLREDAEKKKISEEEAQKQLDEYFSRQEKQLQAQQQRLDIEKKYYAELSKTLTARQLVKIFGRQQGNRPSGQQRPGGFSPQGGHGGGHPGGGFGGGFDGGF